MIYIISADNRRRYHHLLTEMHRQRKAVFIDKMGWPLEEIAGLEMDCYDREDALYLIESETPIGGVIASARLIPTTRPHLLGERFADLCERAPPSGASVWEATRFCPAPETPPGAARKAVLGRMIAAIMETALLFGIEQVVYVADPVLAPMAISAGWTVRALGAPRGRGRNKVQAFAAEIDAIGLRRVRDRHGIGAPLTRFVPVDLPRAA